MQSSNCRNYLTVASEQSSSKSSSNSWSTASSVTTSDLPNPHFSKQFLIVFSFTSAHVCIYSLTFRIVTSLMISDANQLPVSIHGRMKHINNFLYLCLKFLILPASQGCSLNVVFLGRNSGFMFLNLTGECQDEKLCCLRRAKPFYPQWSSFYLTSSRLSALFQ